MVLAQTLHWLGFGLCHQLPERSFLGGGIQVPVCARDEGIYVGFVVALALIWLLHRPRRPRGFPGAPAMAAGVTMIALMALDGLTSYSGMRTTTNDIRLATGLGAGFGIAMLIAPMAYGELWRRSDPDRVLAPWWRLAIWVAGLPVTFVLLRYIAPYLGATYPVLVAICVVATLVTVNMVVVALVPRFERRATRARDLLAPGMAALALSLLEIAGSALVKELLLRAAGL